MQIHPWKKTIFSSVLSFHIQTGVLLLLSGVVVPAVLGKPPGGTPGLPVNRFEPIATYGVSGEVAEIVATTPDGLILIYTDSEAQEVGFVDISDPLNPNEITTVATGGEPTSVAITPNGAYALVTVKVDIDSSFLLVLNLGDLTQNWTINLGGEPDSVDVSPDGQYAVIAIENEREDGEGEMGVTPAGFLVILDLQDYPTQWNYRTVSLKGYADRFPDDPEPEFVSINANNYAAVTLQENNWIVGVDLRQGKVVSSFSSGTTGDDRRADLQDDDQISFTDILSNARLEPDGIGWTPQGNLVTANEGDYDLDLAEGEFVGGRSFTIFSPKGELLFDSGPELEMVVAAAGLYNDGRSDNKGVETEGIEIARYLNHAYLFVGMERASAVAVYRLTGNERSPQFVQVLETGNRPEGLLAIPNRGLFVTANEGDGTISIFVGRP